MDLVILCGGLGTRISHIAGALPKAMMPIGRRSALGLILDQFCDEISVSRIVLCVGYRFDVIQSNFGYLYRGIPIFYSREESPLGTGGALRNAIRVINIDRCLIANGDTIIRGRDLKNALHNLISNRDTSVLAASSNGDRFGTIDHIQGTVVSLGETKTNIRSKVINSGIWSLSSEFTTFLKFSTSTFPVGFEEVVRAYLEVGGVIKVVETSCTFIDIGVEEDYRRAIAEGEKA